MNIGVTILGMGVTALAGVMALVHEPHDIAVADVIRALDDDFHPASGWVTDQSGKRADEAWLCGAKLWVHMDGRHASGWQKGSYQACWYQGIDAWRIRRAFKRWARRNP